MSSTPFLTCQFKWWHKSSPRSLCSFKSHKYDKIWLGYIHISSYSHSYKINLFATFVSLAAKGKLTIHVSLGRHIKTYWRVLSSILLLVTKNLKELDKQGIKVHVFTKEKTELSWNLYTLKHSIDFPNSTSYVQININIRMSMTRLDLDLNSFLLIRLKNNLP